MGKKILGAVVGYVVLFVIVFTTFTIAYLAMGADGAFKPGVYEPSGLWIVVSIILSAVAAIVGGLVAVIVGKDRGAANILIGIVLVLGLVGIISQATSSDEKPEIRTGDVSNIDAMQNARQPMWVAIVTPLIGVGGVLVGACLKKGTQQEPPSAQ